MTKDGKINLAYSAGVYQDEGVKQWSLKPPLLGVMFVH